MFRHMIRTSNIVLLLGLQYYEMSLILGAQTVRRGRTGPVSHLRGGMTRTGCFLFSIFGSSVFGIR
jgi:hypothetical protein